LAQSAYRELQPASHDVLHIQDRDTAARCRRSCVHFGLTRRAAPPVEGTVTPDPRVSPEALIILRNAVADRGLVDVPYSRVARAARPLVTQSLVAGYVRPTEQGTESDRIAYVVTETGRVAAQSAGRT
jgi:hypothetical protein